jgi:putative membrane protein
MATKKEFHAVPAESHAREFLASERTFLAWIRTSIAVIGFGFAVIKFDAWTGQVSRGPTAQTAASAPFPIGGLMILLGGILAALGAWHYRRTNRQIREGKVTASNWLIFLVAGLVILLSLIIIVYLVFLAKY